MAASARAFDNYEMLESILLQLPIKDLYMAKSVAPSWHDLICYSKSVQKRMFLLPDGNPQSFTQEEPDSGGLGPIYTGRLRLNPALGLHCAQGRCEHRSEIVFKTPQKPGSFCLSISARGQDDLILVNVALGASQSGKDDSCHGLLITQPPITAAGVWLPSEDSGGNELYPAGVCTIYRSTGLTIGDLYDTWARFIAQCESPPVDLPGSQELWAKPEIGFTVLVPCERSLYNALNIGVEEGTAGRCRVCNSVLRGSQ